MANVAIYWDFENIHASLATLQLGKDWYRDNRFEKQPKLVEIAPIMEYAASLGNININRAYANWTQFVGYGADLQTHAIDLIQLYPRGSHGKNGADIRLATDVIEDIGRHPQIDTVLVVGGDSDYIAIAQRVRERGHRVVGIGVQQTTNRYWIASCNEFKFYASLQAKVAAPETERPPESQASGQAVAVSTEGKDHQALRAAHDLLRRAMNQLMSQSAGAPVKRALVKTMMLRLDPAFDEADLGFKTFTEFLLEASEVVGVKPAQPDYLVSLNGAKASSAGTSSEPANGSDYAEMLQQQGIQLPMPEVWDVAMEETFGLIGGGRFVPSPEDYKQGLAVRLSARGIQANAAQVKRVVNVLWRTSLLRLDGQAGRTNLVADVADASDLSMRVRLALAERILEKARRKLDAGELARILFGSADHRSKAETLLEALKQENGRT